MPVSTQVDPASGVMVFSATGELMLRETRAALESFFEEIAPEVPSRNLWDLRDASIVVSLKEIDELVDFVEEQEGNRGGGRAAIVTPSMPTFDLARLYETRRGRLPVEVKLFQSSDLEEAKRWLTEGGSPPAE